LCSDLRVVMSFASVMFGNPITMVRRCTRDFGHGINENSRKQAWTASFMLESSDTVEEQTPIRIVSKREAWVVNGHTGPERPSSGSPRIRNVTIHWAIDRQTARDSGVSSKLESLSESCFSERSTGPLWRWLMSARMLFHEWVYFPSCLQFVSK